MHDFHSLWREYIARIVIDSALSNRPIDNRLFANKKYIQEELNALMDGPYGWTRLELTNILGHISSDWIRMANWPGERYGI